MTTLADRLKESRIKANLTQMDLGKAVGVSQNAIQKIESGQTLEPRNIIGLAQALGVDPVWLKLGNEESNKIRDIVESNLTFADNQAPQAKYDKKEPDIIVLDVLDVSASAGYGSINGDMIEIVSQLRFVPEQFYQYYSGINPNNIRIINVKGDSMLPTINHGDLLFVDIKTDYFDGDGIYVFTFNGVTYVKRLQRTGKNYTVISDNQNVYKPWLIEPEDFDQLIIHGKVKVHQSQKLNFIG